MNVKTDFKLLAVAVLMTTSLTTLPTNAQAASWHKGTPKVMRGMFQAKRNNSAQGFGDIYTVKNKSIDYEVSNMPRQRIIKVKYKKIKANTYRITGHMQKNGFVLAGHYDWVYYYKNHKFATLDYSEYKSKKYGRKYLIKKYKRNPAKATHKVHGGGKVISD